ncbi:MAG: Methylcrotonoyl-CoA carboxylase, partial [uncultured bacterium]
MILKSQIKTSTETFKANYDYNLKLTEELNSRLDIVYQGGGTSNQNKHKARNKMLARERIEFLLDADSSFMELSPLA